MSISSNAARRRGKGFLAAAAMLSLLGVGAITAARSDASAPGTTGRAKGFTANITNPWFPLVPGQTLVYEGTKDGKHAVDYVTTTFDTVVIDGARCRVVIDRLYLEGNLAETTADYYTQDSDGNVHYFGEDTASFDENGNMEVFGTDGTWHAGEFNAKPGTFMPAQLEVGASYEQEFLKDHAEDHFQIVDLDATVTVPYDTFHHVLLTKEWTPLEPNVLDNKYYVRGIGEVREIAVKGPKEQLDLVAIQTADPPRG